jgi:hypothetical protein
MVNSTQQFAHKYGYLVFDGAEGIVVLADAPYFQAIAQVEFDSGIVDVLRLKENGVAATISRPIGGAVEQ